MAGVELSADALAGFDFDPHTRALRYPYTSSVSWPIPIDHLSSRAPSQRSPIMKRSTSPLHEHPQRYEPPSHHHHQPQSLLLNPEWPMPDTSHLAYQLDTTFPQQFTDSYALPFHTSPTDFMPSHPHIDTGLPMQGSYLPVASQMEGMPFNWQGFRQDIPTDLMAFPTHNGLSDMNLPQHGLPDQGSPSDTYLEVRSLTSGSENGWATVDYSQQSLDSSMQDPQAAGTIFNPSQTIHGRTFSDSSYSDLEQQCRQSWSSSYVEVPNAISSPSSDSHGELDFHREHYHHHDHDYTHHHEEETRRANCPPVVTTSMTKPINIKQSSSPQRSLTSSGRSSPPTRRQARKSTNPKSLKSPTTRKPAPIPKVDTEKRIGRRKGPLRPEQRKQAGEIRKLGACLRCKFLKKTVSTVPQLGISQLTSESATRANHVRGVSHLMLACGLCHVPASISRNWRIS